MRKFLAISLGRYPFTVQPVAAKNIMDEKDKPIILSGALIKSAREAIVEHSDERKLKMWLTEELECNLDNIVEPGDFKYRAFELLTEANKGGWMRDLLEALKARNPPKSPLHTAIDEVITATNNQPPIHELEKTAINDVMTAADQPVIDEQKIKGLSDNPCSLPIDEHRIKKLTAELKFSANRARRRVKKAQGAMKLCLNKTEEVTMHPGKINEQSSRSSLQWWVERKTGLGYLYTAEMGLFDEILEYIDDLSSYLTEDDLNLLQEIVRADQPARQAKKEIVPREDEIVPQKSASARGSSLSARKTKLKTSHLKAVQQIKDHLPKLSPPLAEIVRDAAMDIETGLKEIEVGSDRKAEEKGQRLRPRQQGPLAKPQPEGPQP